MLQLPRQATVLNNEFIQTSNFELLSDELILHIFSFLAISDVASASLTYQHLKRISEDDALWQLFTGRYFSYAEKTLSEITTISRRAAFRLQFDTVFDPVFFSTLKNKKLLFSALIGRNADILESNEDSDTKTSLLVTSLANGNVSIISELDYVAQGLALVLSARNQNLSMMEKLHSDIKASRSPISFDVSINSDILNLFHKALIHSKNIRAISRLLQTCTINSPHIDRILMIQAVERYGFNDFSQQMLEIINQRRSDINFPSLDLTLNRFYPEEAVSENKCIEIFQVGVAAAQPYAELTLRLASLTPGANNFLTETSELKANNILNRAAFIGLGTLAIQQGYSKLLINILKTNETLSIKEYESLGINHTTDLNLKEKEALIKQRMAAKAFIAAVKSADLDKLRVLNNDSISPVIRGKAFLYAASHSQLEILSILLSQDGDGIENRFVNQALKESNEEVNAHLLKLKFNSTASSLIPSRLNAFYSEELTEFKWERFFDQQISDQPAPEDLSQPAALVLAFNELRTKVAEQTARTRHLSPAQKILYSRLL